MWWQLEKQTEFLPNSVKLLHYPQIYSIYLFLVEDKLYEGQNYWTCGIYVSIQFLQRYFTIDMVSRPWRACTIYLLYPTANIMKMCNYYTYILCAGSILSFGTWRIEHGLWYILFLIQYTHSNEMGHSWQYL